MSISFCPDSHPSFWKSLIHRLNQPLHIKCFGKSFGFQEQKPAYISQRSSKNGKGMLFFVSRGHSAKLATYKFTHKDGKGSIVVVLNHLGKLRNEIDDSILKYVESGELHKAESLCKQRKNMHVNRYTHRVQIFRVKKQKHLAWLVDFDFHKHDSYGSGTAGKVLKAFLITLLDKIINNSQYGQSYKYGDALDRMVNQDLIGLIRKETAPFYGNFPNRRIHCMISPDPSLSSGYHPKRKSHRRNH
ncbi:MAG: hypothetical protein AB4041_16835 [Microcystaceae cyanobacterium]